ncbi:hypothetical protein FHJ31_04215 [Pseudomonas sp. Fig-3]|nr:hypothetical protein FHJ31_04215 [Pseudomonas sp. Fig-3]
MRRQQSIVGASLLAITVCQPTCLVTDGPLSRAGSLPQGLCGSTRLNQAPLHPGYARKGPPRDIDHAMDFDAVGPGIWLGGG